MKWYWHFDICINNFRRAHCNLNLRSLRNGRKCYTFLAWDESLRSLALQQWDSPAFATGGLPLTSWCLECCMFSNAKRSSVILICSKLSTLLCFCCLQVLIYWSLTPCKFRSGSFETHARALPGTWTLVPTLLSQLWTFAHSNTQLSTRVPL